MSGSDIRPNQAATPIRDRFQQWRGRYLARCARLDEAMQAIETAIREWWGQYQAWDGRFCEQQRQPARYSLIAVRHRFQQWRGRYLARCARLDEAMQAIETAIRDQWWGQYQDWDARFREQQHQPARYSLIAVRYPAAVAKWLLGLSGAGTVLAFTFYMQSYQSILSIKNDCVSQRFVAHAMTEAVAYAYWFMWSGMFALAVIALPTAVGIGRNLRRWYKAQNLPPLQPGQEFEEWSDFEVTGRVTILQWVLVAFSFAVFFSLTFGMKPEGVLKEWHYFELQCLPPQYGQGAS